MALTTHYKLSPRAREILVRIYRAGGVAPTRHDLRGAIALRKLGLVEIDLEAGKIGLTAAGQGVAINLIDPAFADGAHTSPIDSGAE